METTPSSLKSSLRSLLTDDQAGRLRQASFRALHLYCAARFPANLQKIGDTFGAGKHPWYAAAYERHFASRRLEHLNILEIGIGGYETARAGGGSLRMWQCYFPHSKIFGLDIYDKAFHNDTRIKTFRGSQADPEYLRLIAREIGRIDIVIDDGSHINEHMVTSFETLFPLLNPGGIYVVEDTQSAYWPEFGGSHELPSPRTTALGYFRERVDGLNHEEFRNDALKVGEMDRTIVGMHFYHNMVFLEKGANSAHSLSGELRAHDRAVR